MIKPPANWRDRDDVIKQRCHQHVCVTRHFFDLFASPQAAYRRLARLVAMKQMRIVGEIMIKDSGRPEKCYCNGWKPKPDHLRHEVLLTDFLFCYPESDVVRGWLVDKQLRPDAEMTVEGLKFYVEMDTGSESHSQVRRRQRVYVGTDEMVLFVALSERRRRGLLANCLDEVKEVCLFGVLDEVMEEPKEDVWVDVDGNRTSLVSDDEGGSGDEVEGND